MGVDHFDFTAWRKCYDQVLLYENDKLLTEASPQGEYELRKEIAEYVLQARGVHCNMDRIVIGGGVQVLLGLLSFCFGDEYSKHRPWRIRGLPSAACFQRFIIWISAHSIPVKRVFGLMKSKARFAMSARLTISDGCDYAGQWRVELLRGPLPWRGLSLKRSPRVKDIRKPVPSLQDGFGDRVLFRLVFHHFAALRTYQLYDFAGTLLSSISRVHG